MLYSDVYEYIAMNLFCQKSVCILEEKDIINFDLTNSIFKKVVGNNKLPEFFLSVLWISVCADKEIGVAFIKKNFKQFLIKYKCFKGKIF